MNSLFIGRYQPFHEGHKRLMEVVLKEGKNIVIALRDTEIDEKNPFTIAERSAKITWNMTEWYGRYQIIAIPDISEICYGRDVGYKIRQIELNKDLEAISGTKIRMRDLYNDSMDNWKS